MPLASEVFFPAAPRPHIDMYQSISLDMFGMAFWVATVKCRHFAASTTPTAPAAAPAANDPAIAVALALLLVVVAVVGCCSALVAVSAAELESLRSDRRLD